jgi:glycosyltransferase involved in cell wall biosynthesis
MRDALDPCMKRSWAKAVEWTTGVFRRSSSRAPLEPAALPDIDRQMRSWWPLAGVDASMVDPVAPLEAILDELDARDQLAAAGQWALMHGRVDLAMALAEQAVLRWRSARTLRAVCRIAYEAARLDRALPWADALEACGMPLGRGELRLVAAIRERAAVLQRLDAPRAASPLFEPRVRRSINLLAYSLPHTSNGYATRSHGLLSAWHALGWDVLPVVRAGAADAPDAAGATEAHKVGALQYRRLISSSRQGLGQMAYLHAAADEIRALIEQWRPQVVHAASNYMTALPACLAAREAGLPFVYEVRGFWDVTRASSDPSFAATAECRYLRLFEGRLLEAADAIITLTSAMKAELVRRGAAADRVWIAPNAVDADVLQPRPRDPDIAAMLSLPAGVPVIGYVGSVVDYEGLDDLVQACAILRQRGLAFHLLVVGDGLALPALKERIAGLGLELCVTLGKRVEHSQVPLVYSLIDICAFPRKPWPVCELVSPLKPLEAMAFEKAVVVSDVGGMAGMVRPGDTGEVFPKGNVQSLADSLTGLLTDLALARAMGRRAREWVRESRSWRASASSVQQACLSAIERAAVNCDTHRQ